jgi:hypothetical protein
VVTAVSEALCVFEDQRLVFLLGTGLVQRLTRAHAPNPSRAIAKSLSISCGLSIPKSP